jgi:hypothetical protein
MSGPPSPITAAWANNPHAITVSAVLTPPSAPGVALDVVGGQVVWDAGDTWRTSATLDVPFTLDTWQLVKDYSAARIEVSTGCVQPNGTVVDVALSGPLVVRRAAVTRPEDLISLTLASEASLVDDLRFTADTTYPASNAPDKIIALITDALPLAQFSILGSGPGLAGESNAGSSRWEAVEAVADYAALEVWQDTSGVFIIRPQPVQEATPVDVLAVGPGGNIIESFSDFDRDNFANAYAVRSAWINSNGQTDYAYGIVYHTDPTSDTRWDGPAGNRVQVDVTNVQLTDAECQQVAVNRLRRALGHSRGVRVTVPLRPWLKPGDPISVELPTGGVQVHTLQRAAHDLTGLTTTIDTRLLTAY